MKVKEIHQFTRLPQRRAASRTALFKSMKLTKAIACGREMSGRNQHMWDCPGGLRLRAPNAGGPDMIPVQGTRPHTPQLKISHAAAKIWHHQISPSISLSPHLRFSLRSDSFCHLAPCFLTSLFLPVSTHTRVHVYTCACPHLKSSRAGMKTGAISR